MSAIEKYIPADNEIDRIQRIATDFAKSGYFADAKEALQAFVKISAGAEMGLQPFVSMSGIAIIQGKPVVGAGILAGLLDDHPDFDYTVTWDPNSSEPTACTVTVFKNGVERGASRFSMADAEKAGLASKDVWKKFQRNMLFARAMSNAVAFYAPSVTRSNGRVYVEGELDDVIDTPAPTRRKRAEATPASVTAPPETVIEAEVVPADPVMATAEVIPVAAPEAETSAGTTNPVQEQTEACKALLKAMTPKQREVVKEACEHINVKWDAATPFQLVKLYGVDAAERDTLLARLAENVSVVPGPFPPIGEAEGEVDGAERFDEFLEDDTARNIAAAEAAQAEAAARIGKRDKMAAAGSYGEQS